MISTSNSTRAHLTPRRGRWRFLAALGLIASSLAIGSGQPATAASNSWSSPCWRLGSIILAQANPHIAAASVFTTGGTHCKRIQADLSYTFFGSWDYLVGGCVLGSAGGVWTTTTAYGNPSGAGVWAGTGSSCYQVGELVFY